MAATTRADVHNVATITPGGRHEGPGWLHWFISTERSTPARYIVGACLVGAVVAGFFADLVLDVDAFAYVIGGAMVAQVATGIWWQRREKQPRTP